MHQINKSRAGFSLTELAIVMLIMSIIFGGVWGAANNVRDKGYINNAISVIPAIARNVKAVYTGFPTAAVPTVAQQISRGMFLPSILNQAKTNTLNSWDGLYQINFLRIAGRNRGFFLELTFPLAMDIDQSRKVCIETVTSFQARGKNVGNRAGISANLPVRNEAQGEVPTNVLINDIDMTGLAAGVVVGALSNSRCSKLSYYYPF